MNIYEKESYMKQKPTTLLGYHQVSMKERKLMDVTGIKKLLSLIVNYLRLTQQWGF